MSKIEELVCEEFEGFCSVTHDTSIVTAQIRDRAVVGEEKYGVTMERTDVSKQQWLQHLNEELMDALNYATKLRELCDDRWVRSDLSNLKDNIYSFLEEYGDASIMRE
jgi:hypothetical protein